MQRRHTRRARTERIRNWRMSHTRCIGNATPCRCCFQMYWEGPDCGNNPISAKILMKLMPTLGMGKSSDCVGDINDCKTVFLTAAWIAKKSHFYYIYFSIAYCEILFFILLEHFALCLEEFGLYKTDSDFYEKKNAHLKYKKICNTRPSAKYFDKIFFFQELRFQLIKSVFLRQHTKI